GWSGETAPPPGARRPGAGSRRPTGARRNARAPRPRCAPAPQKARPRPGSRLPCHGRSTPSCLLLIGAIPPHDLDRFGIVPDAVPGDHLVRLGRPPAPLVVEVQRGDVTEDRV